MICQTCGNDHQENYCPHCGEKKFDKHELSLKHYLEETFEGLLHFDNKFFRSVKMLIARPGQLTREYVEGRRIKYMKPVQLFVIINLLFFFLLYSNPFNLSLRSYTNFRPFTNFNTKAIVDQKLQKTGRTFHEYEQIFDGEMRSDSKEFIFLFIPVYGLIFAALFFWQKRQFVEYLIFATHFYSFILIFFFVLIDGIVRPYQFLAGAGGSESTEDILNLITVVAVFIDLVFAIRKFFSPHLIWTLLTAALLAYSFFYLIQFYRMLLFFKIVYLS